MNIQRIQDAMIALVDVIEQEARPVSFMLTLKIDTACPKCGAEEAIEGWMDQGGGIPLQCFKCGHGDPLGIDEAEAQS